MVESFPAPYGARLASASGSSANRPQRGSAKNPLSFRPRVPKIDTKHPTYFRINYP